MAKFLCRASEEKLWQIIVESCSNHNLKLDYITPTSAIINTRGFICKVWQVTFSTSTCASSNQTLLWANAKLTSLAKWCWRVWFSLGVCLLASAGLFANHNDSDVMIFPLFLSSILILLSLLIFSFLSSCRILTMLNAVLCDIQTNIKSKTIKPFEIRAPWSDRYILVPFMVLLTIAICIAITGPLIGICLSIPFLGSMVSFLIIKPLLGGWRGLLHSVHFTWQFISFIAATAIVLILFMGLLANYATYHKQPVQNVRFQKTLQMVLFSNEDTPYKHLPPSAIAKDMTQTLELKGTNISGVLLVVGLGILSLIWMAISVITDGLRTWKLANLQGHPPLKTINPSSETLLAGTPTTVLLTLNAIIFGICHWFAAILSVEVLLYYLLGKSLVFPPIAWSLEFLKMMLHTKFPMSISTILVAVLALVVTLPSMALLATAFWRILKSCWCTLSFFRPSNVRGKWLMARYASRLNKMCEQEGLSTPNVQVIDSKSPILFSERSLIPGLRGKIVISTMCQQLLSESEILALFAHEIHHLKHDAFHIQGLKVLSIVFLCPVYYFLILYDFARHEYEADAFAVKAIEKPEAYKSALIKLQVALNTSHNKAPRALSKNFFLHNSFFQALSLYFDNSIFAAAYPTLHERLDYIDSLCDRQKGQL